MEKKPRINTGIQEQFANLKISSLTFQAGGIYKTKDINVLFPSRKKIDDKPRFVVVMGNPNDLEDPMLPHVSVIPVTTKFELQNTQDYPLSAGDGNLYSDSLAKVGFIQPILKSDFEYQVGKLDHGTFEELKASVFMTLGLGDDEVDNLDNEEPEDKETEK